MRKQVAVLLLTLAVVSGCASSGTGDGVATLTGGRGEDGASASPTASKDPQDAAWEFARCMREHGVDMPDPGEDGLVMAGDGDASAEKVKTAHEACRHLAPDLELEDGDRPDPETQDRMLSFARCMRNEGIDMPDPDDQGGLVVPFGEEGTGPDPRDEDFQAAEEICRKHLGAGVTVEGPS